ncbi:MAG: FAD-binding oxidoreductase [Leptospirillia bacterium]
MPAPFHFETEIIQVVLETADVFTFRIALPEAVGFTFCAGQFVNLTVDTPEYGDDMQRLTRPYSISSSPTEGPFIDLTVKYYDDGHLSKHLREVTYIGEAVTIDGPHGKFFFEEGMADSVALIGGGAGVAPMRGILRYIADKELDVDVRYLASCRTPNDTIYLASLVAWENALPKLAVRHTITRPEGYNWHGLTGRIDAAMLRDFCPPERTELYYVAGPTDMVSSIKKILKEELGVDKARIHWEPWG